MHHQTRCRWRGLTVASHYFFMLWNVMSLSILLYKSSLKRALNPLERTDSLRCSVELLGGENVSLIALRRSSSSRVGLCRVENMAPSHWFPCSLVLLLSLSLPIYWNWSKWLPCSLLHLFNLCHCHCQSTSRCQNKLPLNAPISLFTPFENGGKHWGNYKRRSGSSFSAAMPTTDGREEGWVTRARIPLRERARVRVLLLPRPGPQKRLGSSRTCLRDAFAASTPNARVRFCAAAGAVGREIASNFDASTKAR